MDKTTEDKAKEEERELQRKALDRSCTHGGDPAMTLYDAVRDRRAKRGRID